MAEPENAAYDTANVNSTAGDHVDDSPYYYDYDDYYYHYVNDTDAGHVVSSDGREVYRRMLMAGIIPVCLVGLVGNTVSVWAWNALKKRNSVVMLFQCLGILDNVFLLLSAVRGGLYSRGQLSSETESYVLPVLFLAQSLSVHVTMVIGVFRQLAVARVRKTQRMTRRHVLMTCGGLLVWCGLLTALTVVMEVRFRDEDTEYVVMAVLLQFFGFVLPTLVLLGFSVSLLRITFHAQMLQSKKKHRRTTLAVLGIAGCSFLACPVAVTGHLMATFWSHSTRSGCSRTCVFATFGAGELLQVLNSSVNFLFYFFFASTFKPLLRQIYRRCANRFRSSARKFSVTSGALRVTSDSDSGNFTVNPQQQEDNKDDTVEDIVEMAAEEAKVKPSAGEPSVKPSEGAEEEEASRKLTGESRNSSSEDSEEETTEKIREESTEEPKEPTEEPNGKTM